MKVGIYSTDKLLQEWYLKELVTARKVLKQFNQLNQLFDEFKGYESKQYYQTRNTIMLMCLPDFNGSLKLKSIKSLIQLEDSLRLFDVLNWSSAELNKLKSSLCDDDYDTSISPYTELMIAKHLAVRLGNDNVKLYPELQNGRFSDILVKINGKSVYIEIGNLGISEPEKKIQKILDNSAKYLGKQVSTPCFLEVEIDTAEFVFDENILNVKKSISKLTSEIDKYCVQKLAGFKGIIFLDDIIEMIKNLSVYEEMEKIGLLLPKDKERLNLVNESKIKEWNSCCNLETLGSSKLIKSIIGHPSKYLLVEIHTENFYPSKAAMLEQGSFVNHILRNVRGQLEEEQIQPNEPNIIIIQAYNWIASGIENFEPIRNGIIKFLDENKQDYLSGIGVFSNDFENILYVSNKYALTQSKLNDSEIAQLSFK